MGQGARRLFHSARLEPFPFRAPPEKEWTRRGNRKRSTLVGVEETRRGRWKSLVALEDKREYRKTCPRSRPGYLFGEKSSSSSFKFPRQTGGRQAPRGDRFWGLTDLGGDRLWGGDRLRGVTFSLASRIESCRIARASGLARESTLSRRSFAWGRSGNLLNVPSVHSLRTLDSASEKASVVSIHCMHKQMRRAGIRYGVKFRLRRLASLESQGVARNSFRIFICEVCFGILRKNVIQLQTWSKKWHRQWFWIILIS